MFEVPYDKKSIDQDKYEFKVGTKVYKVKRSKYLSGDEAATLASFANGVDGDGLEAMFNLFGERGTPAGDIVREIPITLFGDLVNDWAKESGLSVGESQAS